MSKIAIKGATTGTGTFTIESPATNTDRTLTLPDEAGTVLTSASDLSGVTGAGVPDAIDVNASAPADSLAIDASGNVGIGTSSPSDKLHVNGGSLRLQGAGDGAYATAYASGGNLVLDSDPANTGGGSSMLFGVDGTERMRIKSDGRCIWSTDGSITSQVADGRFTMKGPFSDNRGLVMQSSNSAGGDALYFCIAPSTSSVGRIAITSSGTTYHTSSDYRLKENITDLTGAITRVKQLQPRQFNFISDPDDTVVDGFIAHEVSSVCPEAIYGEYDGTRTYTNDEGVEVTEDDYQGMDYGRITPLLTAALQEAIAKIETLETTVADLQTRVTALEAN